MPAASAIDRLNIVSHFTDMPVQPVALCYLAAAAWSSE